MLARAIIPELRASDVFSHMTAAVLYGWPMLGAAPDRVHVIDLDATSTTHREGLVRHAPQRAVPLESTHRFCDIRVTSPMVTAVLVATTCVPSTAAVTIDHGVRSGTVDPAEFGRALPPPPARGSRRARLVAAALDARHESVGESYTAIRLVELGVGPLAPQHEFRLPDGSIRRVDFWIPSLGVVLEFDGRQKYVDPTMLAGRDGAQVLWQEKIREDQLRALPQVRTVIRVTWWHLADPERLRTLFRQHGITI
ncbi:hypothetical protein DEI91_06380 [Curtobacterium sp. MCBD17_032]|nr:hypothetical protein DEI91_06380 [Curtobacterium sp. MCBD17_032]